MIAIVDYNAGNLTSVSLALAALRQESVVTRDPAVILAADRVIFPGVGAAGAAMRDLRALGLEAPIRQVAARGTPFLGICVGTQILFDASEEDGGTPCIGLVPGQVKRFRPTRRHDKVPQIGWNTVRFRRAHPVLAGLEDDSEFYFVHSYYPLPTDSAYYIGETTYADATFSAIVGRGNLVATQFHVEKSGRLGLRLLDNFCHWNGQC